MTLIRAVALRVLVVEDEPLIAMETEQMLARLGCDVVGPASTLAVALRLLDQEHFDFAILDVNLGRGERSTPVAEALQERGIPFVLSSGYTRSQLPEPVFRDVPQLGKPMDHRRLADALSFHCKGDG
jgi:CheY-like chemotaxis protein